LDFSDAFHFTLNGEFFVGILSVIIIDLVLAGDNAVVIALAAQTVQKEKRSLTILAGSGLAVALRVILTFFAAQLLRFSFIKLGGGILIFWIGIKLLGEEKEVEQKEAKAKSVWHAIKLILVADLTMSVDNVLALAGASKGSVFMLLLGLGLSIPLVIFASAILASLMERYPIIVYVGAAVLGKVAAELIMTDPAVTNLLHPPEWMIYAAEALGAVIVVLLGKLFAKWQESRAEPVVADPLGSGVGGE
jgi:YjbE family integral membrane protein